MAERPVETILAEWRVVDRALADCTDAGERIDLERASAALADEYRDATDTPSTDGSGQETNVAG